MNGRSCNISLRPCVTSRQWRCVLSHGMEMENKISGADTHNNPGPAEEDARFQRRDPRSRVGRAHAQIAWRRHRPKPSRHHMYHVPLRVSEKRKMCVTGTTWSAGVGAYAADDAGLWVVVSTAKREDHVLRRRGRVRRWGRSLLLLRSTWRGVRARAPL
jgi:hypothetical protein